MTEPDPAPARPLERLREFLGLRKNLLGLCAMVILVGMGDKLLERFLPMYLRSLGGDIAVLGILGGMTNLLGALYSFPAGYLSDWLGFKRALLGEHAHERHPRRDEEGRAHAGSFPPPIDHGAADHGPERHRDAADERVHGHAHRALPLRQGARYQVHAGGQRERGPAEK